MNLTTLRSEHMRRIRSGNTRPELILRKLIWASGWRYRVRARVMACKPDLVFKSKKVAVFVDGCFWHGCPDHYSLPRTRVEFWRTKLEKNVRRDQRQTRALEAAGWRVIRFWGHEVHFDPKCAAIQVADVLSGRDSVPFRFTWRILKVQPLESARERRTLVQLGNDRVRHVMATRNSNSYPRRSNI
jgi:DNA mismatch endonuclease, patch repair protein